MACRYLLITYDFPPAVGGISRYYQDLIRNFPPDEIVVWTVRNRVGNDVSSLGGIRILRSSLRGDQIHTFPSVLHCASELSRVIRRERPLFLLCGNIRPFGPVVRRLAGRFGIPYLVFTHGLDISRALMKMARNPFYRAMQGGVLGKARWIVANSSYTRGLILEKFPGLKGRIAIVHPGVDTEYFRPGRGSPSGCALLSVGRLTERKGVAEVIRSLPAVLKKFPRLVYNVVGDGDYRRTLVGLARELGLREKVRFHFNVSDSGLRAWNAKSDIFLMVTKAVNRPEDVEGFGIVYLEAAASGLPVLASSLGGVTDAVINGKTGLLTGPEPSAIAGALLKLLGNRNLRERLGGTARRRCVREFQWKHSAAKLRLLLEDKRSPS